MEVQKVQEVQGVQIRPIRPIRLIRGKTEEPILWRTALQAEASRWVLIRGRCPRLLMVVPSRHRSACGSFFTTDYADRTDECPMAWQ